MHDITKDENDYKNVAAETVSESILQKACNFFFHIPIPLRQMND